MGRTLKRGIPDGDDVRQLQVDLRRMLPSHHVQVTRHGHFGPETENAVRLLQHKLNLHKDPPGVAGPEVQRALEYRVIEISGSIGRKLHLLDSELKRPTGSVGGNLHVLDQKLELPTLGAARPDGRNLHLLDDKLELSRYLKPLPDPEGYKPAPLKHYTGGWLAQLQPPVFPGMITPPPLYFRDPQHGPSPGWVASGGFSFGFVYRTAKDGRHWEPSPPGIGFFVNTKNAPSDPRYTLQIGTGVTWADLLVGGRFHLSLVSQLAALINLDPYSVVIQGAIGPQITVDIIEDKLNIGLQGTCGPQWNLTNGQFQFGCSGVLAATLQWELHRKHHHHQ